MYTESENFRSKEKNEIASSKEEINSFIADLRYMSDDDKYYWAVKDAQKLLSEGLLVADLKEKYQFYDDIAREQHAIDTILTEMNVPFGKKEIIRNIIRQKTSEESHAQKRQMKWEHVQRIKKTVEELRHDKITLKNLIERKIASGDVHFGVIQVLNEDIFRETQEIFPDRFWRLSDQMHPNYFPNFATTFNFALQKSFLHEQSQTSMEDFSKKIKIAILHDAEELLSDHFTIDERKKYLKNIKIKDALRPSKIMKEVLQILSQKEKRQEKTSEKMKEIKRMALHKNTKGAFGEIKFLKKKYGKNIIVVLGERDFFNQLQNKMFEIKQLERELENIKNPKKREQLFSRLQDIQNDSEYSKSSKVEEKSQEEKKSEIKNILQEINEFRRQGNLESAENASHKLKELDTVRAKQEVQKIKKLQEKEKRKKTDSMKDPESETKLPEGKKKKVVFLERCIEHAKKIIEECGRLGIPKDDPKFWGLEGVRNRVAWLRNHGQWETYTKFNMSDKNMPSRTQNGGFRFRWVDSRGSELTPAKAEEGTKYLNRYRESGYALATLAGVFSMNWKGSSSPVYTPEKFILLVQDQLSKVKAE